MTQLVISESHASIREAVSQLLSNSARETGHKYSPLPLTLALEDNERIVGGLTGATNWDWLYIETLAVAPEFQRQGLARQLVQRAEQIARQRGCRGSWVDTFTFQAPDVYIRLGYEEFGRLPQYPAGHSRLFLRKIFTSESS